MSTREQCISALETLILASPGVKSIFRQFTPIDELASTNLPCVILEDDGQETITHKTGGLVNVAFDISVIGYVESQTALSTAINTLDVAVKKAIANDITLGGVAIAAVPQPYNVRSGTANAPYGWFDRPIRVTYEGIYLNGF